MDDQSLSEDMRNKLSQFQDMTGIDDTEFCKNFLRAKDWNLEKAVGAHFNLETPRVDIGEFAEREQHLVNNLSPTNSEAFAINSQMYRTFTSRDNVYMVIVPARPPQSWIPWMIYWFTVPLYGTYATVVDIFKFLYDVFYGAHQRSSDARRDMENTLTSLKRSLGPVPHLSTKPFTEKQISRYNRVLPLMVVMIPTYSTQMRKIGEVKGRPSEQDMITYLNRIFALGRPELLRQRHIRDQRLLDNELRQQQDKEYSRAMEQDRAKIKEKLVKQDVERELEKQKTLNKKAREARRKEFDDARAITKALFESRPARDIAEGDAVKIQLKMPDGSAIKYTFAKSDPCEDLFNLAMIQNSTPRAFRLFTNFPRKAIERADCDIASLGLHNNSIFVLEDSLDYMTDESDDLDS